MLRQQAMLIPWSRIPTLLGPLAVSYAYTMVQNSYPAGSLSRKPPSCSGPEFIPYWASGPRYESNSLGAQENMNSLKFLHLKMELEPISIKWQDNAQNSENSLNISCVMTLHIT